MKKLFTYTIACCVSACFFVSCSKEVKSPVSASNASTKVTNTPAQNPSQAPSSDNNHHSGGCNGDASHSGS